MSEEEIKTTSEMAMNSESIEDSGVDVSTQESVGAESENIESAIPELSDEQLHAILEKREDFKFKVKVSGKEEDVSFKEYKDRISHQTASSRLMNEAKEKESKASAIIDEIRYVAHNGTPEEKAAFFGKMGFDVESFTRKKEEEREQFESLSEEGKEIVGLKNIISELKKEVNNIKGTWDSKEQEAMTKQFNQEMNAAIEKYPLIKDEDLKKNATFLVYENPSLSAEEACKIISDKIERVISAKQAAYMKTKKEDASKGITVSDGSVPSHSKKIREMKSMEERLEAILANKDNY